MRRAGAGHALCAADAVAEGEADLEVEDDADEDADREVVLETLVLTEEEDEQVTLFVTVGVDEADKVSEVDTLLDTDSDGERDFEREPVADGDREGDGEAGEEWQLEPPDSALALRPSSMYAYAPLDVKWRIAEAGVPSEERHMKPCSLSLFPWSSSKPTLRRHADLDRLRACRKPKW